MHLRKDFKLILAVITPFVLRGERHVIVRDWKVTLCWDCKNYSPELGRQFGKVKYY